MPTTEKQFKPRRDRPKLETLEFLISRYMPANRDNAEFFFTTREISGTIIEHTGIHLPILELNDMLTDMGYQKDPTTDTSFVWMLRRTTNADSNT